jgi:hypothetical protein
MIFVKCRLEGETGAIIGIYDHSHFQDIFLEERQKESLEELEKIWNQEREMC